MKQPYLDFKTPMSDALSFRGIKVFLDHIDVEVGFQSLKSTIAETGMGVTSRP